MFVDIIKVFILQSLATDNDQQSYQRLTQTSERGRFGAFWTFCALLCELGSRAIKNRITSGGFFNSHCTTEFAPK